jgi:hypothetical protein
METVAKVMAFLIENGPFMVVCYIIGHVIGDGIENGPPYRRRTSRSAKDALRQNQRASGLDVPPPGSP